MLCFEEFNMCTRAPFSTLCLWSEQRSRRWTPASVPGVASTCRRGRSKKRGVRYSPGSLSRVLPRWRRSGSVLLSRSVRQGIWRDNIPLSLLSVGIDGLHTLIMSLVVFCNFCGKFHSASPHSLGPFFFLTFMFKFICIPRIFAEIQFSLPPLPTSFFLMFKLNINVYAANFHGKFNWASPPTHYSFFILFYLQRRTSRQNLNTFTR